MMGSAASDTQEDLAASGRGALSRTPQMRDTQTTMLSKLLWRKVLEVLPADYVTVQNRAPSASASGSASDKVLSPNFCNALCASISAAEIGQGLTE